MKKFKIVFNLITVALTTGLLVIITLAWYAVNKTANVTAGTGMVAQQEKLVKHVDYYKFSAVSEPVNEVYTYTVGGHIGSDSQTHSLSMNSYSYGAAAPTIYYIRIELQDDVAINQIKFISSATSFVGFSSRIYPDPEDPGRNIECDDTDGVLKVSNKYLSLSSVIRFAYLGCSGANTYVNEGNISATFGSIEGYTWDSFDYSSSSGAITTSTKNVLGNSSITANGQRYIHLLLDYDINHLNEFYGNNLANQTILTADGGPKFTNTDFTIYLLS